MNKIYRNNLNGMLAVVRPDGTGTWVASLSPILSKIDVTDGRWTEVDTSYDVSR